jgi:pimeloyl-ACP methyl ester carboxylesterase
MALYSQPLSTDLSRISASVTLLHGLEDVNVPVEVARWLAAQLPGAELVELVDAGHLFLIEQPRQVIDRVPT